MIAVRLGIGPLSCEDARARAKARKGLPDGGLYGSARGDRGVWAAGGRAGDGPPVTVRVIEYTVYTTPEGGTEQPSDVSCLVTDLLDIDTYPVLDLACAYPLR